MRNIHGQAPSAGLMALTAFFALVGAATWAAGEITAMTAFRIAFIP